MRHYETSAMKFKKSTISAIIILVALTTIIGLSGVSFLIPNKQNQSRSPGVPKSLGMEKIFITTKDNIEIAANLYQVENPVGWVVLVHMMPSTKESWQDLASDLENSNYETIAFDLRGHGESTGGSYGYQEFSDEEHQKSILDLESAVDYLIENRGAVQEKISFIGASIGANLSLQYISEHPEFKTAVLLSAGLNYRGIKTKTLVENLKEGQGVFFVSSQDDDSDVQENQTLYNLVPDGVKKEIKIYENAGHGTTILEKESELKNLIFNFIE